jgi:hypothetical protein
MYTKQFASIVNIFLEALQKSWERTAPRSINFKL